MSKESTGEAEHGWLPLGSTAAAVPPLPARAGAPARDLAWDAALSCWHHAQGQRGSGRTQGPSLLQTGGGSPGGDAAEQPCGYRGWGGGGECCKSTAGCPGVCTSHACPASCPGLPTSPRGPKPPYPPPAGLRLTGKQHRAGAGGFGMVGGGGWGGWRPLGPSPELGVVDQGAEGGGEGGRFALQPR